MHSLKELWVFDATAWDLESGISTEARHYLNSHEAVQDAVEKLKERLGIKGLLPEEWNDACVHLEQNQYLSPSPL